MNPLQRIMGKMCDTCPICTYARNNPETLMGRIWEWHGKWCPFWKAQKELQKEREGKK
jgi:hypothetical protein